MLAIRVLLVDDDEVVRMTLTGVVEQSGFAITSAANVPEGFKTYLRQGIIRHDAERPAHARSRGVGSPL